MTKRMKKIRLRAHYDQWKSLNRWLSFSLKLIVSLLFGAMFHWLGLTDVGGGYLTRFNVRLAVGKVGSDGLNGSWAPFWIEMWVVCLGWWVDAL